MTTDIEPAHQRQSSEMSTVSMSGNRQKDQFSSIAGLDDLAGDDDLSFDDLEDSKDILCDLVSDDKNGGAFIGGNGKKLKRPASSAEKKATHNAVERARRESLNARFLVLADLLPGMTHVKRASKAAIVNKSIELIKDFQTTESRLAKENESLKLELATLKQQWGLQPSVPGVSMFAIPQGPVPAAPAPTPAHVTPALPTSQPKQEVSTPSVVSHPQHSQHQRHSMHNLPLYRPGFGGIFGLSLQDAQVSRSESGSPSSHSHSLPNPPSTAGSNISMSSAQRSVQSAVNGTTNNPGNGGYFDTTGTSAGLTSVSTGSPNSFSQNASANSNATPSPASSHSVPTPGNAYSPNHAYEANNNRGSSPTLQSQANPAMTPFDGSSDASYLAAQFAPRDLAKAHQELQSFIAYQQRMTSGSGLEGHPHSPFLMNGVSMGMPGTSGGGIPFTQATSHSDNASPFCGNPALSNVPAWQMMMSQQAPVTSYGGSHGQF